MASLMPWSIGLMNSFGTDPPTISVDELVAFARLIRLKTDLGVTVLTAATGLSNVFALGFGLPANGLAVRHLRLTDVRLDLVLAHHAVDDDLQVQLNPCR